MEQRNPKRKLRKTRKALDHIRKRSRELIPDNELQDRIPRKMSTDVTQAANAPNMTDKRLTLATQSYNNVVISETIRRSLMEKLMSTLSPIPYRVSTQLNDPTTYQMCSGTENVICERNSILPSSPRTMSTQFNNVTTSRTRSRTENMTGERYCFWTGDVRSYSMVRRGGTPVPNNIGSAIASCYDFVQRLPDLLLPRYSSQMILHPSIRRELRESNAYILGTPVNEESEREESHFSDENDSLLNPLEYIRRGTITTHNRTVSYNLVTTGSQTSPATSIVPVNSDSSADSPTLIMNNARVGTPTESVTLCDTPECEYFPRRLNQ